MTLFTKNLLFFFLFISTLTYGQSYEDLIAEGDRFYSEKDFVASLSSYESAFAMANATPNRGELYNAACSAALAEEKEKSISLLNKSIDAGWISLSWMLKDGDLVSLHQEDGWKKVVTRLEAIRVEIEKDWNKPLMRELEDIGEKDQRHRKDMRDVSEKHGWDSEEMNALWAKQSLLDSLNQLRIIEIIKEYGYPGKSLVGDQSGTAFLVIQHADIEMQEQYLPILTEAAEKGELRYSSLALLIDRVRMRQNKPQLYGSQLQRDDETGGWRFYTIEDEKNVNKRRAEVGLSPLEEYAKRFGLDYVLPKE